MITRSNTPIHHSVSILNPNPVVKKLWLRPEKGCDEKDVKSKGGGQGLCRNAVNHIKNFDDDDPGRKTMGRRLMKHK